jgi:hypothetical protein
MVARSSTLVMLWRSSWGIQCTGGFKCVGVQLDPLACDPGSAGPQQHSNRCSRLISPRAAVLGRLMGPG